MEKPKALSVTKDVYNFIKNRIIYGKLRPGELLNERELAAKLQVSKTPVREALKELTYEKLVEVIPYKGYFVQKLSLHEIKELFEIRMILESQAARLAVQRATDDQISQLKSLTQKKNEDSFFTKNVEFHVTLAGLSGNKRLVELIKSSIFQLQPTLYQDTRVSDIGRMEEEHLLLVKAIEQGDEKKVEKITIQQLKNSQMRVMNFDR